MTSSSSSAHIIRLRGPWTLTPLDPPGESVVHHPHGDGNATRGESYRGRARYERRFGRPTNLDADERVTLIVERPQSRAEIVLNDVPLGTIESDSVGAYDATDRLSDRNALSITLERTTDDRPDDMIFAVRLEIRRNR